MSEVGRQRMLLSHNKSVFITGNAGTGKSTKCNELKSELNDDKHNALQPISQLLLFLVWIILLISIHKTTPMLRLVSKDLVKKGVKWIFTDEISMIPSKIWAVLRDIKRIFKFDSVMSGDMGKLNPVETKCYEVIKKIAQSFMSYVMAKF